MNRSVESLDDVSIERIMRCCTDLVNAALLISLDEITRTRVLKLLSNRSKRAILVEMEILQYANAFGINEIVNSFWRVTDELENKGEIIIRKG